MKKNPFIKKKYVILESGVEPACHPHMHASVILSNKNKPGIERLTASGYSVSEPVNIIELETYLSAETNKFFTVLHLAKTCDNYTVQSMTLPTECAKTFRNFPASWSQFRDGANVLDSFIYTDSYIASHQSPNDQKQMCQRLRDLQGMIRSFSEIIQHINTTQVKEEFPEEYNSIMTKYNENQAMRELLDQKLDNIYSMESGYGNSKRMLDSTIYVSVLWTILATTFVFYIFKKM